MIKKLINYYYQLEVNLKKISKNKNNCNKITYNQKASVKNKTNINFLNKLFKLKKKKMKERQLANKFVNKIMR